MLTRFVETAFGALSSSLPLKVEASAGFFVNGALRTGLASAGQVWSSTLNEDYLPVTLGKNDNDEGR